MLWRCTTAAADNPGTHIRKNRSHLAEIFRRCAIAVLPVHIIGDTGIGVYGSGEPEVSLQRFQRPLNAVGTSPAVEADNIRPVLLQNMKSLR
ncbi:hypothetical protein D3C81_1916640 [compost metagenome]